jgi:hypothetical protein
MAEVTEINPPKTDQTEDSPSKTAPDITTPARKHPGGRPTKNKQRPPEVRQPQFFDRVAAVPKEDWGTRAFMYVYADEPVCKAKTFGTTRYLLKSSVPILDLEGLTQDYGSFKGWMSLNLRKTGKDATDEVDRLDFEIYNHKYPPKIPRAAWANDDRNARWIALLPPEPVSQAAATSTLIEGARFYKEIRDEVKDEMEPAEPQQTRTSEVLETMKAAKELFGPSAPPATATPPPDPFDTAAKIMAMRANDPMTAVLMGMIDSANKSVEAAREREFKLQEKLLEAKTAAPQSKSFMEQALDLANDPAKLEPLKKLASAFGFGGAESATRAGRTTGMDILNNLVSGPAGEVLARGAAQLLITLPSMLQPNPANTNGQQVAHPPDQVAPPANQQPAQETPEQRIYRIGMTITRPMIAEWFMKDATGQQFAAWMNDSWPDDYQFIKLLGSENLIQRYRNSPVWAAVSFREKEFIAFIQEFCEWTEPKDEAEPINAEGVEDLEDKEAVQ